MPVSKTVIISCAGMGSRLGMNMTKALIKLHGKTLIEWQLDLLKDVEDVRIVVGYQYTQVIETVLNKRKDVIFVFNHDFRNTGTAASFVKGVKYTKEDNLLISLDGDLLIHPEDLKNILESDYEFVGVCDKNSEEPVYVNTYLENGIEKVGSFSKLNGQYEWTGLAQISNERTFNGTKHVYQLIEPFLPIRILKLRSQEIDTYTDYENALRWIQKYYQSREYNLNTKL